ncbi:MAG: NDP-sugar synthase [Actinomycetota bacterium]
MHAVVLVGGFGTRLRPLTNEVPKPMLPVGHRPMIVRLIERLARGGVDDVTLALGFKPEPFVAAFPDGYCGAVAVHYAVEPEPLDTGGAIRFAADSRGIDDTFVVANGDVMTDLDVGALVEHHRHQNAEATLHLIGVDDPSAFGVVDIDDAGLVHAFVEKPAPGTEPSNLINAGTYVFEPKVLERIPSGERVSIERDTFPMVVEGGGLHGLATTDYWIDAGRPDLYRAANLDLLGDQRRFDKADAIAPRALVDPAATVEHSIIGADATVEAGAVIRDSVILEGAQIGADAQVSASLVAGTLGARAVVIDSIVGAAGVVAAAAELVSATEPSV